MNIKCYAITIILNTLLLSRGESSEAISWSTHVDDAKEKSDIIALEQSLIEMGVNDWAHNPFQPSLELLCVVAIGASARSAANFHSNVEHMKHNCDWAVVGYEWFGNLCYIGPYQTHIKQCHVSENNLDKRQLNGGPIKLARSQTLNMPKSIYYSEVSVIARNYKYIMFLDEDMSLLPFDAKVFLDTWSCAMTQAPMLMQTILADESGDRVMNSAGLDPDMMSSDSEVIAMSTKAVNHQAPVYDSRFFVWLSERVLNETRPIALTWGVDAGLEKISCEAARLYGIQVLGYTADTYSGCGIIIKTQIHHLDFKTTKLKNSKMMKFSDYNKATVKLYAQLFPNWISSSNWEKKIYTQKELRAADTCIASRSTAYENRVFASTQIKHECNPFCGPMQGSKEAEMLKIGIASYSNNSDQPPLKNLLCVVFMGYTSQTEMTLLENVAHMKEKCDWALLGYRTLGKLCFKSELKPHLRLCRISKNSVLKRRFRGDVLNGLIALSVPKSVYYAEISAVAMEYKYVLVMDEDMSLLPFDVEAFFETWSCTILPPPLIVQSLVTHPPSRTGTFPMLNADYWSMKTSQNVVAAIVPYVEQQAPVFDSRFFVWFADNVLNATQHIGLKWGADWGFNRMWCEAARSYGVHVLRYDPVSYRGCGLITKTRMRHLDFKTIKMKTTDNQKFNEFARNSIMDYASLFPIWWSLANLPLSRPLREVTTEQNFTSSTACNRNAKDGRDLNSNSAIESEVPNLHVPADLALTRDEVFNYVREGVLVKFSSLAGRQDIDLKTLKQIARQMGEKTDRWDERLLELYSSWLVFRLKSSSNALPNKRNFVLKEFLNYFFDLYDISMLK